MRLVGGTIKNRVKTRIGVRRKRNEGGMQNFSVVLIQTLSQSISHAQLARPCFEIANVCFGAPIPVAAILY